MPRRDVLIRVIEQRQIGLWIDQWRNIVADRSIPNWQMIAMVLLNNQPMSAVKV